MIDNFIRDLQLLWKADTIIGRVRINVVARRVGLCAVAALVGAFGLAMANAAAFYALRDPFGSIGAAAAVSAADFVLAALVLLIGLNTRPGPEMDLALDVHKMALEALRTDARDIEARLDTLTGELRSTKETVLGIIHNPLDAATQKLLVPAIIAIVKGMRARKNQT